MRPVLCGLAAGVIACHAIAAEAQQGTVRISTAAQALTGASPRIAGENRLEPDAGIAWLQPGARFGTFQIELRGTRRADRLHVGRSHAALRELKYAGLFWTFEAGDTHFTRTVGDYRFSNLTPPSVTFSGGAISGRGTRGNLQFVGGRATAWRNIFGNDPDTLGQTLAIARGSYRLSERVETTARLSRVQTSDLREFTFSIADSRQAGGGIRLSVTPAVDVVADGSVVQYRRVDSATQKRDASFFVGAHVHLSRGWVQLNASRFSPGDFPAMNDPLHDRESVFAAGEYEPFTRARLFGGSEVIRTNIDPELSLSSSRNLPRNRATRWFGGARLQLGERAALTVRAEDGDRLARPVLGGHERESDTRLRAVEWQSALESVTAYVRLARRQHVDRANADATYRQDDLTGQIFKRLGRSVQVFGLGAFTRHSTASQAGSTYWQIGGGAQAQFRERNLWFRAEGTASRNVDLVTRDFVPRESFNIGLNGDMSRGTTFGFNVAADRTPLLFGTGTPWTTRSTVHVTRTFSTGTARVRSASGGGAAETRARGTGTVLGLVYADWNGNGTRDPDESPLENIPLRLAAVGAATTTSQDGEFAFLNVPAGTQTVGLDTSAVPVDFDPPAESLVSIELDRGSTRRVSFGLIPLGSIRGRVVRDANGNGRADPDEESIDEAVVMLDRGARSEQVRKGAYRFESIRSGDHTVSLLRDSLPEGATVAGPSDVQVTLGRDHISVEIDFAIAIEKRPETRRVFPGRGGRSPSARLERNTADRPVGRAPAVDVPYRAKAAASIAIGHHVSTWVPWH